MTHSSLWSPAVKTNTARHKNPPQWTFQNCFFFLFFSSWSHSSLPLSTLHCCFFPSLTLLSSLLPIGFSCLCLLIWLNDDIWHSIVINWNDSPCGSWQTQRGNWNQQMTIGSFFPFAYLLFNFLCQTLLKGNMYTQQGDHILNILSPDYRQQILWSKVCLSPRRLKGS